MRLVVVLFALLGLTGCIEDLDDQVQTLPHGTIVLRTGDGWRVIADNLSWYPRFVGPDVLLYSNRGTVVQYDVEKEVAEPLVAGLAADANDTSLVVLDRENITIYERSTLSVLRRIPIPEDCYIDGPPALLEGSFAVGAQCAVGSWVGGGVREISHYVGEGEPLTFRGCRPWIESDELHFIRDGRAWVATGSGERRTSSGPFDVLWADSSGDRDVRATWGRWTNQDRISLDGVPIATVNGHWLQGVSVSETGDVAVWLGPERDRYAILPPIHGYGIRC